MAGSSDSAKPTPAASSDAAKATPAVSAPQASVFRSLVPYIVAAIAAVVVWGSYFFVYVPPKLQYFESLRFRTLAISAQQLKSKIETLVSAVSTAQDPNKIDQGVERDGGFDGAEKYLTFVVPELRSAAEVPDGLQLGKKVQEKAPSHAISWPQVMAPAVEAAHGQFDDLVLTDQTGRGLWQLQATSPRIGSLGELLNAPPPSEGWFSSLQWSLHSTTLKGSATSPPTTATSNVVDLDGVTTIVMTQPVQLNAAIAVGGKPSDRLYLIGLVSQSAIKSEALHVPTEWIVLATLPFVLLFLTLPFVKLATVTSKERYGIADVVALAVAMTLVAAIAGGLPFLSDAPSVESDTSLKAFASEINRRLGQEAREFLTLAHAIEKRRRPLTLQLQRKAGQCTVAIRAKNQKDSTQDVCNLWETLDRNAPHYYSDLDVVSWIGDDGFQRNKWTAKNQVTGLIRQDYQHFHDVRAGRVWRLTGDPVGDSYSFTIEPLRSPTTSEMAFVFAVPSHVTAEHQEDPDINVLALNVKPQSLVDPIVPRGYGFVIIALDGHVLFHSNSALSLEENFLQEVGNADVASTALRAGVEASWTGDYHGRQHRFYATSVSAFAGSPWQIVTFREIDSLLGRIASRQSATIALYLIDVSALIGVIALILLAVRLRGWSVLDTALTFSIQSRDPRAMALSIIVLTGLTVASIIGLLLTYSAARGRLTSLLAVFMALPFAAIAVVVLSRWWFHGSDVSDKSPHVGRSAIEMFLVALLIGAIPAAGLARIVYREDALRYAVESLRENQSQLDAYVTRIRGTIAASRRYNADTKDRLLGRKGFDGFADEYALRHGEYVESRPDKPASGSYLSVLDDSRVDAWDDSAGQDVPSSRLADWLTSVRNVPTPVSAPLAKAQLNGDGTRLRLLVHPEQFLSMKYDVAAPRIPRGLWLLVSGGILAATFFVVLWTRWRLSSPAMPRTQDIADLVREIHLGEDDQPRTAKNPAPNPIVLLIGPPRTGKDTRTKNAVLAMTQHIEPLRIPLLDQKLSDNWLKEQLKTIAYFTRDTPGEATVWVHLSNLEAQLVSKDSRTIVFQLIERLLDRRDGGRPVGLIVTTTIDPLAHFNEIFQEERSAIYSTAIPEVELNRLSLLLTRMRRCYTKLEDSDPWPSWLPYDPAKWKATLEAETSAHPFLKQIRREIEQGWPGRTHVPLDEMRRAIVDRAQIFYRLLWTSCTRTEKLVLIQLAQEGLVNPKSQETLQELLDKGLIRSGASLELFNFTFRDFLRRIEPTEVVQAWERMDGSGLWVISSRLIASVLIVGGLFYLLTQGVSVQSVLPLVSGSSFLGIPVVRNVANLLASKKDSAGTTS
jgi:hypothetical protein